MFRLFLICVLLHRIMCETVCGGFGYNWAAEIRCLRTMLTQCQASQDGTREVRSNLEEFVPRSSRHPSFEITGRRTTQRTTTTTTTTTPRTEALEDDFCFRTDLVNLRYNLTKETEKALERTRDKMEREMRGIEDRFNHKYFELKRKSEMEMKKVMKRVKLMTSRVFRFLDKEYIFVDDKESWYGAEEQCVSWGGHLVSIKDPKENEFVRSLHSNTIWLSINDVQLENAFVNTDGTITFYRNWFEGQPDNANHNENCIEMDASGRWWDQFCLITREYVCKR